MRFNYFGLNSIDYAIILVVLLFGLFGYKKGFMRSLVGIASLAASIIIAWILYPVVSDILNGLGLKEVIANTVFSGLEPTASVGTYESGMPKLIADYTMRVQTDISNGISIYVADVAIKIISFVLVLIIAKIIIQIGLKFLNIFSKLPVISTLNHIAGFAVGAVKGTIIVYLIIVVLLGVVPMSKYDRYKTDIENSAIVNRIYLKNPVEGIFIKDRNNENGE